MIIRAAQRVRVPTVFVANKNLTLSRSEFLSTIRVGAGLDIADTEIATSAQKVPDSDAGRPGAAGTVHMSSLLAGRASGPE